MTAKEYLRQIRRLDRQLELLFEKRTELEKAQIFMRSPRLDGSRVQTSPSGDPPWMNYLTKWDELTIRIGEQWDRLIEQKNIIADKIMSLPDERHIKLLELRYIDYKSFEEIAVEMGYSFDYVLKLHGRALVAFREVMDGKEENKVIWSPESNRQTQRQRFQGLWQQEGRERNDRYGKKQSSSNMRSCGCVRD